MDTLNPAVERTDEQVEVRGPRFRVDLPQQELSVTDRVFDI